ncbi:NAD(P)-dependent oxidoreductase [Microlunatus elymi]|uniref:NAD(P)-dependent oxidoreductase n=1 Tax=Microlunatus elymi TaxID=2596828 RepID=UPI001AEFAC92|nr:NAD(P)H-binding protein [Microlunatus elymi]
MTAIALFGATGRTGRRVLDRALAAGLTVRALVRDLAKLTATSERLSVVRGDVLDPASVAETVSGADVVLSLFGQVKGSSATLQTAGTLVITNAMAAQGVKRIVTLSGGGLRADRDRPKIADRAIQGLLKLRSGRVLADAEGHLACCKTPGSTGPWFAHRG